MAANWVKFSRLEDCAGASCGEESWLRNRLYFRRRGAHSECASPTIRIALSARGERWRVASRSGCSLDRVRSFAEEGVMWDVLASSRGSYTRIRELIHEKGRLNYKDVRKYTR